MKQFLALLCLVTLVTACVTAGTSPAQNDTSAAAQPVPAWFLDEIATLTSGSGRWEADNAAYKSKEETFDTYVTEWTASFDGTVMSGRLFGIRDGKETPDFWEFKQYWHPQRGVAVVEQFGWGGTVGIGTAWREGSQTKSRQTFYLIDGTSSLTGHISSFPTPDTHMTNSYDIRNEEWLPQRKYTWHRIRDNQSD